MNVQTAVQNLVRNSRRLLIVAGAGVLSVVGSNEVLAQSANATLRGKAPANAEVTAKNTETGLTRKVQVGADGRYVLVGLPPGTYQVEAGPGTAQVVQLEIASTATVDLDEGSAPTSLDTVDVVATRYADVKTSEVGRGISLHQIETTPQITRNFLEFADTVPGMQFEVDSSGNTRIRTGPQNLGAMNVFIDGVGQKNYVRSSGVSGQGGADPNQNTLGSPGNPFPQLAIAEYKVITSNYSAEYDQLSGAAITAVTKSGTNELEAEAFAVYTDGDWRAQTPAEIASGRGKQGGPNKEYGFAIGGPIVQDKMHYYLTFEGKEFTTPNTVFAADFRDDNNVPIDYLPWLPADLRANFGPVANPFKETLVFGKLDWDSEGGDDRVELTAKYRRERQQAGASGQTAASAASTYVNDDKRVALKWQRTSGNLLNEMTFAFEDTTDSPSKVGDEPGQEFVISQAVTSGFNSVLRINGVDPRSYFFTAQRGYSVQNDLTFSNIEWHGDHKIKVGAKLKAVKLQNQDTATEPLYKYYIDQNGVDANPFEVVFGAQTDPNADTIFTSKNRQIGIYFQDDWQVNDHWQFNLGVRYDYEQTPGWSRYVTPQRFVDAIFSQDPNTDVASFTFGGAFHGAVPGQTYADTLANAGININDYISTGRNRKNPSDQIQPRLGFSYDFGADQRHVLFGGAGRSYDRNVFGILQHEANKATLYTPTVQFFNANNPGCSGPVDASPTCVAFQPSYLTAAGLQTIAPSAFGEMHFINNNLKAPYSDQISLGMRNRVGAWNTSVTFSHVESHDGLIASSGNFFGDGTWYWYDTFFWSAFATPVGNGAGNLFLFDNTKGTRTQQVLVSVDKPYTKASGWSTSISYTFSNAKEKLEYNGDYQFDYPFARLSPYVSSNQVPKHRLVMVGSIDAPWGLTFAGKVVLETPRFFTAFDQDLLEPPNGLNYNFGKMSQLPKNDVGYRSVDLQVSKVFEMWGESAVQVRLDLLNAFNHRNYDQYFDLYPNGTAYNENGNIRGVPRTFKLSLNVKF